MNRALAIGGAGLLLLLLVLAVLGLRSCATDQNDVATAQTGAARSDGFASAAVDGAAITTNVMTEAASVDATTRKNDAAIRTAPGAHVPVAAPVNDAGLRALCMRAAYRDQPRCAALLRSGAGAAH